MTADKCGASSRVLGNGWNVKRLGLYTVAILAACPSIALAYAPMADYWQSFADGTLGRAVDMSSDMLPILALLGGLAVAERIVRFVLRSSRG